MNLPGFSRSTLASALTAALALGCEATQPAPYCRVQQDQYAARYTVQGTPPAACAGKVLAGEILHLQYYRAAPTDPAGLTSVAIEPDSVFHAVKEMMATVTSEYSIGKYTTVNPGDDDRCRVPTFSETSIMMGTTLVSYAWSNLEMIVTAVSNGIHFGADLVRKEGDCTLTYKVSAVNPALHCGDGVDMMGHPDPTTGKPNPKLCEPVQGSGLSPDLGYQCVTTPDAMGSNHLCLPAGAFPSLK
jgi:hypothetical protein